MHNTSHIRATAFLTAYLNNGTWPPGQRLPTVRDLARLSRVSTAAMSAAVRELCAKGVVRSSQRSGIRAGAADPSPPPAARPRAQALCDRMHEHILTGALSAPLPPLRALSARYGAGARALGAALAVLESRGLVERNPRGWRHRAAVTTRRDSTLLIIAPGTADGVDTSHERLRRALQVLERECEQRGLRCLPVAVDPVATPTHARDLVAQAMSSRPIVGSILWPTTMPPSLVATLLPVLGTQNRPVAVLDELARVVPPAPSHTRRIRVYRTASTGAARTVARHLLALGHRAIAYVDPFASAAWSPARTEAFVDECARAGVTVQVLASNVPVSAHSGRSSANLLHRALTRAAGLSREQVHSIHSPSIVLQAQELGRGLNALREQALLHEHLRPLLRSLLAAGHASAIAAANDATAGVVLDLVREGSSRRRPAVSCTGFDNTAMSLSMDLTSYDFMFGAMAHRAAAFVLRPDTERAPMHTPVECEGLLIHRHSSFAPSAASR